MFVRVNAVNIGLLFVLMFQGETIVRNNSVDEAVDYRDGMAKVCCPFFSPNSFSQKRNVFVVTEVLCTFTLNINKTENWRGGVARCIRNLCFYLYLEAFASICIDKTKSYFKIVKYPSNKEFLVTSHYRHFMVNCSAGLFTESMRYSGLIEDA